MKDELAEHLLATVMSWDEAAVVAHVPALQALAELKYDEYEGFRPGEQFVESLAVWLEQFEDADDRAALLRFVLSNLVFVSRAELDHLITLVYPDVIRPLLRRHVGQTHDLPLYRVRTISESSAFASLQRRTLVLGLADGARLDRLRRACPQLSHEQFYLVPELSAEARQRMRERLRLALEKRRLDGEPQFSRVILVDDFSGSGYTLIHEDNVMWAGKLPRCRSQLDDLVTDGVLDADHAVTVVIYVATEAAQRTVAERLAAAGMNWGFEVIQVLGESLRVADPDIVRICRWFYDPALDDEHKGSAPLGFADLAMPLVLSHNTPNDSVSILWADTRSQRDGLKRAALFPRYERHHPDRP